MSDTCIFGNIWDCSNPTAPVSPLTETRRASVIKANHRHEDSFYTQFEDVETISAHLACAKSYTSESHIQASLKRLRKENESAPQKKKTRRSHSTLVEHCLFCGAYCAVEPDKKNPSRWRIAYLVRTVDRKTQLPFKDVILNSCTERADAASDEVRLRVNGAITDLHSAEARYHESCRKEFMGHRNVRSASSKSNSNTNETDVSFETICKLMLDSPERIWSSIELHKAYESQGGTLLSRK